MEREYLCCQNTPHSRHTGGDAQFENLDYDDDAQQGLVNFGRFARTARFSQQVDQASFFAGDDRLGKPPT